LIQNGEIEWFPEHDYKPSGCGTVLHSWSNISFWKISQSLRIKYLNYLLKRKLNF